VIIIASLPSLVNHSYDSCDVFLFSINEDSILYFTVSYLEPMTQEVGIIFSLFCRAYFKQSLQLHREEKIRAEPILGSVTRFGRVSATRQYLVLGRHKPADTK